MSRDPAIQGVPSCPQKGPLKKNLAPGTLPALIETPPDKYARVLSERFGSVINQRDMRLAAEGLRDIAEKYGLGVAMMVSHQHGLKQGHIPLERDTAGKPLEKQVFKIVDSPADNPFVFVNVPVRGIRQNIPELIKQGIMNPHPRTSGFVYHEDALIGAFTLDLKKLSAMTNRRMDQADAAEILALPEVQGVLDRANVNSIQVHFKNTGAKRLIEASNEPVYVRGGDTVGYAPCSSKV